MVHRIARIATVGLLVALLVLGGWYARGELFGGSSVAAPAAPPTSLAVDAADGSLLKAAGGLFRSSDQGRSWQPLSLPDGLGPGQIRQVATTGASPERLYAAGPGAGILRSDDRGQTWRTLSDGLPSQDVGAFALHSNLPDTLYSWIEGKGVFRTEDGGGRWELMDPGPPGDGPPTRITTLAHSTYEGSMNTGWLYAATPDGPYLSMDCF